MRLSVLLITIGAVLLIGFAALQRQLTTAQSSVSDGSDAASALDLVREVSVSGGDSLALIVPLGLGIALVLGVITISLGSLGGVGR